MIVVETDRLVLRHFRLDDGDDLDDVFGDREVMRFGPGVQSPRWVRAWLRRCLESYAERGFGPWAVVERNRSHVIGYCGLFHLADVDGNSETELGYRLKRPHWGLGYATEAARAVRDYGFAALGLPRLIALIDPGNRASIRVAEKVGMRFERAVMLDGYTHPDHVYAIASPVPGAQSRAGRKGV